MTGVEFYELHRGHRMSAMPYVAEGGWDARLVECLDCHDTNAEVRAIPAEGCLIDPDPHIGVA